MSYLPKGWKGVKLSEIVKTRKGKKPNILQENEAEGFVPYLDIHAIEKGVFRQFADVSSSRIGSEKDLFVVWDGARSGWVGFGQKGAIGSTIMALETIVAEQKFLFYFLKSQFDYLNTNTRGTGIPHVDPEVFNNLEIPLAPLNEQKRIVEKLEKLLGKVEASRSRLDKIPTILKRFRQSVLAAACSGKLTADWRETTQTLLSVREKYDKKLQESRKHYEINIESVDIEDLPITWLYVPIGNISGFQQGMQIAKVTRFKEAANNRLPILRIQNYSNNFQADVDFVEIDEQTLIASESDVILARTGETRGKVLTGFRGVFHNNTFRLNFDSTLVTREYLIYWLESSSTQSFIHQQSGRSAQPDLTHSAFGVCPFPLAPIEEQKEIVRRVEELFKFADQIEARYTQARKHFDKLTNSILAKTFRGELVPQDENDEPASVLLERVKFMRELEATKPKEKTRQKKMKLSKEQVIETIKELPETNFSFDILREKFSSDYEPLKEILFEILSEKESALKQVFDSDSKSIMFVRNV